MLTCQTVLSSRYRILSVLGQGGMGAVYLAEALSLGHKKVAVKEMILTGFSPREIPQAVRQFKREAAFLANLQHPNLVPVTDFFTTGAKHYLVMNYVEGETLQERLQENNRPFRWDEVKSWTHHLVDVLTYLHAQDPPILFRDLKPSNVMLDKTGHLYLIDFGIARTAQMGNQTSTFLQGTGTHGFSPIEQYGGGPSTDERSDIYALGATLYYLLTGHIPPDSVARVSRRESLKPPSFYEVEVPRSVERLLSRALAVMPCNRYSSMKALARDLALTEEVVLEDKPLQETWLETEQSITVELYPFETEASPWKAFLKWFAASVAIFALLAFTSRPSNESPQQFQNLGYGTTPVQPVVSPPREAPESIIVSKTPPEFKKEPRFETATVRAPSQTRVPAGEVKRVAKFEVESPYPKAKKKAPVSVNREALHWSPGPATSSGRSLETVEHGTRESAADRPEEKKKEEKVRREVRTPVNYPTKPVLPPGVDTPIDPLQPTGDGTVATGATSTIEAQAPQDTTASRVTTATQVTTAPPVAISSQAKAPVVAGSAAPPPSEQETLNKPPARSAQPRSRSGHEHGRGGGRGGRSR